MGDPQFRIWPLYSLSLLAKRTEEEKRSIANISVYVSLQLPAGPGNALQHALTALSNLIIKADCPQLMLFIC